jgi:hypothetical protein
MTMKLRIEIDLEGDDFQGEGGERVVEKMLASIAWRLPELVKSKDRELPLHDHNGNRCGQAEIVHD